MAGNRIVKISGKGWVWIQLGGRMKDQMEIAWKLFPLFAATLRGRKSSRIGRAVPVNNLLHSKPTRPLFSGWWWIDWVDGEKAALWEYSLNYSPPIQSNWILTGWLFEWKLIVLVGFGLWVAVGVGMNPPPPREGAATGWNNRINNYSCSLE